MHLPKMINSASKQSSQLVKMGTLNYTDMFQDGDIVDSVNISARRFPYIGTRNKRFDTGLSNVRAMGSFEELVTLRGNDIYYGSRKMATLTAGEKQFAVVNTKLVVWPDKKVIDLKTNAVKSMEQVYELEDRDMLMYTDGWIDRGTGASYSDYFDVGDSVLITVGAHLEEYPVVIRDIGKNGIFFAPGSIDTTKFGTVDAKGRIEVEGKDVRIEKKVPQLDYIFESENRLWGCSNADKTIYASALGIPTSFNAFEGLSTDSFAVGVGTSGQFTGCCKLGSSVIFMKEDCIHKILGSYPAEYQMTTYMTEGLKSGCYKSLQVINDVLYYLGVHGVYAYSGGTPALISTFGNRTFSDGVAGSDGDTYFLSCRENDSWSLFAYETRLGMWVKEDNLQVVDFSRKGKDLYMLDKTGHVYVMDSGVQDPNIEWMIRFAPFYETIQGRKVYSKMLLRLQLPSGSWMRTSIRFDNGQWKEVGRVQGSKEDVVRIPIPINRCDKFQIELSGKGECTLLSMLRQFRIGSDA